MGWVSGEEEAIVKVPDLGDKRAPGEKTLPAEVRWTVGCLVATLSTVGVLILVALVAIALEPPTWVQVLLGAGLAVGGAVLAWLIASALGERRARN
jgi:hypothetical protein